MKVRVCLFAIARDLAGFDECQIELPEMSTAKNVLNHLASIDGRFSDLGPSLRFAVNQEYVSNDQPLVNGDEVALIPPVSGG